MISAYLGILSIVTLIAMHAMLTQIEHQDAAAELTILSTSQKKFIDLNLKNAVRIALHNSVVTVSGDFSNSCEEKIHAAALRLAEMENFVENYYNAKGIEVNAWSGWLNENNQCLACFDLITLQSEQVLYCNEAGEVVVSRSHASLSEVIGKPAIGFTVKRGNDEWNSIVGEGFE